MRRDRQPIVWMTTLIAYLIHWPSVRFKPKGNHPTGNNLSTRDRPIALLCGDRRKLRRPIDFRASHPEIFLSSLQSRFSSNLLTNLT
jgi:hypothetical protein